MSIMKKSSPLPQSAARRPGVKLSAEEIRSIYPLNKLSPQILGELKADMHLMHMRAGQQLFLHGEAPKNTYWVLDGAVQLSDPKEERIETVSPAHEQEAMPLPYIVPANESAISLVDSVVLCCDRHRLAEVMSLQNVQMFSDIERSKTPIVQSSEELFREFEALQQKQHGRAGIPLSLKDPGGPYNRPPAASGSGGRITRTPERPASRGSQPAKPVKLAACKPRKASLVGTDRIHQAFEAFAKLPGYRQLPLGLQAECLLNCQILEYADGDNIIHQGDPAEAWYLILEGECQVLFSDGQRQLEVNHYHVGGSFGEDGLITDMVRNATVRAVGDVEVVRMGQQTFTQLLMPALLKSISAAELDRPQFANATWVDVRLPREKTDWAIRDALEIPWPVIRSHPFSACPKQACIVACETGEHCRPIAYTLRKFGFDAYFLEGGINQVPKRLREPRPYGGRPVAGGVIRLI